MEEILSPRVSGISGKAQSLVTPSVTPATTVKLDSHFSIDRLISIHESIAKCSLSLRNQADILFGQYDEKYDLNTEKSSNPSVIGWLDQIDQRLSELSNQTLRF